jgi:hypothetical protein
MKTRPSINAAVRRSGTRLPFFTLLPLLFSLSALAEPAPEVAPRDHALFVGTSLQIKDGETFQPLVAANAHTLTVLADGKARNLPRNAVGEVRIEPELKLSSIVAQIDNLKTKTMKAELTGDRFAGDRMQILMDSMIDQNEDVMDSAAAREESAVAGVAAAERSVSTPTFGIADAQRTLEGAKAAYGKAAAANPQLRGSVSSFTLGDLDKTAVEVVCDLSCPRETRDAYALLVTEYRMNSRDKPQYKVHVESLRGLGPKPQRVTMVQGGMPPGFELGRVGVHVFADGQELATNLSEQRVDLTADDALRYLVLVYVAAHTKDTLAAAPLKIGVPADFKNQVSAEQLERPLYVTVGVDGTVQSVSTAPDRSAATDSYVDATVRKFRYNPALNEGKPVESVVPLTLADYVR